MKHATARVRFVDESLNQARTSINKIAESLQETLGQRLTAYAVGLADGRDIGRYARGLREPNFTTQTALRNLKYIVDLLGETEDPATIRNWLTGMNPMLSDRSPAKILREGSEEEIEKVTRAVRKFISQG